MPRNDTPEQAIQRRESFPPETLAYWYQGGCDDTVYLVRILAHIGVHSLHIEVIHSIVLGQGQLLKRGFDTWTRARNLVHANGKDK